MSTDGGNRNTRAGYRPLATYFAWTIIALGVWFVAARTLHSAGFSAPSPKEIDAASKPVIAFIARLLHREFQIGMAILFLGTLLYAIAQFIAVKKDESEAVGTHGTTSSALLGVIAAMSGRPAAFWNTPVTGQEFAAHLRYGVAAALMPLRLAFWVFPMLGFLGTVIGLSGAVDGLSKVVSQNDQMKNDGAVGQVLDELHLAFDTTIQGITCAIVIYLVVAGLERAWQRVEHVHTSVAESTEG